MLITSSTDSNDLKGYGLVVNAAPMGMLDGLLAKR